MRKKKQQNLTEEEKREREKMTKMMMTMTDISSYSKHGTTYLIEGVLFMYRVVHAVGELLLIASLWKCSVMRPLTRAIS